MAGGTGEYDDPYVLMPVKGIRRGSFARSHEILKVSNITPRLDYDFTDMSSEENGARFSMKSKKANSRGNGVQAGIQRQRRNHRDH